MQKKVTKPTSETVADDTPDSDGASESDGVSESNRASAPDGTPDSTEATARLPKDELFHLLQNERRRRAVQYVLRRDGVVDMRDISDRLAAIENDVEVAALTSAQRKRVYVSLYQCHLPKLDEAEVIDYDKDRGTIERTPRIDQLEPYLSVEGESDEEGDERRLLSELPAVATVLAAVLTAGAWNSVLPTAGLWLPIVLTATFALATFVSALG